jgi:hypothetical protein
MSKGTKQENKLTLQSTASQSDVFLVGVWYWLENPF